DTDPEAKAKAIAHVKARQKALTEAKAAGHPAICAVANACTSTRPDIARPALGPDPGGYNGVSPRARNVN
ncbi:MAG: hypothetical protein WBL81_24070, partial [Pseudolabrys sp.]